MMRKTIIAATWVVWLHVLVAILHSVAHVGMHVFPASFFDYAFIVVVIMIAPVVALFLLKNAPLSRLGALLLFLSMLGALFYALVNHFFLPRSHHPTHFLPAL